MFKAVLVDDEILVLNLLDKVIGDREDINIIEKYTDSEKALIEIPKLNPDVIFLDIDMPELNGIELASKLLETVDNKEMEIVFVTAYDQYAVHAFKLNAIHYILKPVDSDSVDEVMERIYKKRKVEPVVKFEDTVNGEINLFGHMHLRANGRNIEFLTPKTEELFSLLVINREAGISKWKIIDLLWEESGMEKSKQNLHTMIFRLKKKLRDFSIDVDINYKNSIYTMDLKDVHCDLKEFDQLISKKLNVNKKNVEEFEKIIYLYKGDLLVEKDYLWCIFDREKYYQDFVSIVTAVAVYYTKNNQTDLMEKLNYHIAPILMEEDCIILKSKLLKINS